MPAFDSDNTTPSADFDLDSAVDEISTDLFDGGDDQQETTTSSPSPAPAQVTETAPPPTDKPATQAPAQSSIPPAPAPVDPMVTPPKTWKQEIGQQHWAALPPEVKAEIHRREEDMFRGLEGYKADANIGRSFKQAVAQYEPIMRQYGIDPMQHVGSLLSYHHTLALGTQEQRVGAIRQLVRDYNIDPKAVFQDPENAPFVDPAVKSLRDELDALKSGLSRQEQQALAAKKADAARQLDAFIADPKNAYYKEVEEDIASLLQTGRYKSLAEAYQAAIWLNPSVRAKEMSRLQEEQLATQRKAQEEAAAKAKAAMGSNVRSSQKRASQTAAAGSMDDTLAEALREIKSRQ